MGAILSIREMKFSIPDDKEMLSEVYPLLIVVKQPAYTMGVLAIELLINRRSTAPPKLKN